VKTVVVGLNRTPIKGKKATRSSALSIDEVDASDFDMLVVPVARVRRSYG